jgi:hypothetical protein
VYVGDCSLLPLTRANCSEVGNLADGRDWPHACTGLAEPVWIEAGGAWIFLPGLKGVWNGDKSASTTRWPRRASSVSAVDLPLPDIPVIRTRLTPGKLPDRYRLTGDTVRIKGQSRPASTRPSIPLMGRPSHASPTWWLVHEMLVSPAACGRASTSGWLWSIEDRWALARLSTGERRRR